MVARYFFHVFNDEKIHDDERAEFSTVEAARECALRDARILAAQSITEHGHLVLHRRIEIENAAGTNVGTIQFGDAVEVRD